jgi:hypothetical protein
VIGATVLMLVALAHQSLRSPRKRAALDGLTEPPAEPNEVLR